MKKRILVTGGYGFIGSSLIRTLLKSDTYEILNLDKLTYSANLLNIPDASENYSFYKIDICNQSEIKNILKDFAPNQIFHLAAESHVDNSIESPIDFIQSNIFGTYSLLEASRSYFDMLKNRSKENFKFIHVSTDEVFGDLKVDSEELFHENFPYKPSSPYSASKASSDHLTRAWNKTFGLPTIITNCTNNYGPFQHKEKLIPKTITNALTHKKIPIYGSGEQVRDWLFVDDHTDCLIQIADMAQSGDSFCIGGNNAIKNLEVVNQICNVLDKLSPSPQIDSYSSLISFVNDRPGHDLRYEIDTAKVMSVIGWKPNTKFIHGIKKTIKWYLENNSWWDTFS